MTLGLPVSDKDCVAAERLLWWIRFLDSKNKRSLKTTSLVLCVSPLANRMPRLRIIMDVADKTFGRVIKIVPEHIKELGWPAAPNQMFQFTLNHLAGEDDLFFIEPDAVPISIDWYHSIVSEYELKAKPARKCFMGAHVGFDQTGKPHMTGIGIYGRQWHQKAPSLMQASTEAWDTFACAETIPNAHWTKQIQHIFNRPEIPEDLSILKPKTVLFHQNKDGRLINLLSRQRFHGELNGGRDPVTKFQAMIKYYHADNVNRRIKIGGQQFLFEPYGQFGGVWSGIFATENEGQQAALDSVIGKANSSITEISQAAYESFVKKKQPTARHLRRSQEPAPPASLGRGAEVAASPKPPESAESLKVAAPMLPATVEEVVMTDRVELTPTAIEEEPKKKVKRKP